MIREMFVVRDQKARIFGQPFFSVSKEVAIRDFAYAANDSSCDVGRFPADFYLYAVGSFDDLEGIFVTYVPEVVCSAIQLVQVNHEERNESSV